MSNIIFPDDIEYVDSDITNDRLNLRNYGFIIPTDSQHLQGGYGLFKTDVTETDFASSCYMDEYGRVFRKETDATSSYLIVTAPPTRWKASRGIYLETDFRLVESGNIRFFTGFTQNFFEAADFAVTTTNLIGITYRSDPDFYDAMYNYSWIHGAPGTPTFINISGSLTTERMKLVIHTNDGTEYYCKLEKYDGQIVDERIISSNLPDATANTSFCNVVESSANAQAFSYQYRTFFAAGPQVANYL